MDITKTNNGDERINEPLQPLENDTDQPTVGEPSDASAEQDTQQVTITETQQQESAPPEPAIPVSTPAPQPFEPALQSNEPATSTPPTSPQPVIISQAASGLNQTQPPAQQYTQTTVPEPNNSHSAGVFILQWVTYALWGWTLLVLSWVIFALVLSILNESSIGELILYPISALVILLPASIVADSFYGKKEPKTKKGGALAIMVIHVVIYVLFMIGFLIAAMFSIVNMAMSVSSGDSNDALGYLISSLLVSACYALLIVRTLRPQTFRKLHEEN